jgi:hypothetical protein
VFATQTTSSWRPDQIYRTFILSVDTSRHFLSRNQPVSPFVGLVMRVSALTVYASLVWHGIGQAQEVTPLQVGARISVSVPDATCRRRPWRPCPSGAGAGATLVRATPDTLVVQFGRSATLSIPRIAGQTIYVSMGASRLRSAVRSAVAFGIVAGVLVAQTDASRRSIVQTTAGMATGGLALGALLPTERWRRVTP